jgi:hypothetical protein
MWFFAAALVYLAWTVKAVRESRTCGTPQGTLHHRNYFYVGGSFVQQGSSILAHGQMYVEHLTPAKVIQPFPLMFIHGNGMTGTNLLNTPDGRIGWADYFLNKGYEVGY